jgi:hypothetical protein
MGMNLRGARSVADARNNLGRIVPERSSCSPTPGRVRLREDGAPRIVLFRQLQKPYFESGPWRLASGRIVVVQLLQAGEIGLDGVQLTAGRLIEETVAGHSFLNAFVVVIRS